VLVQSRLPSSCYSSVTQTTAMKGSAKNVRVIRFSVFEVDRDSGELFKQGRKVKLQGQPFELLVTLLEKAGEVLTRDELRQKIWPSDAAGDFDHGLNRAVNKVREALGDSAETPQFIETLPRRGYRFIGSIGEVMSTQVTTENVPSEAAEPAKRPLSKRPRWFAVALAVAALSGIMALWIAVRHPTSTPEIRLRQLTTNSADNPVWNSVISPDGRYLAYGDLAGIELRLISTGELHVLARPSSLSAGDAWLPAAWSSDGAHLFATSMTPAGFAAWTVPLVGGTATPLRDDALVQAVSPDGSLIAFTAGARLTHWAGASSHRLMFEREIWVMGPHGENATKLLGGSDVTWFNSVRWSPDGKSLAYEKLQHVGQMSWEYTIQTMDMKARTQSVVFSNRLLNFLPGNADELSLPDDFSWLSDGRIILAVPEPAPNTRNSNLWEIAVDVGSGKPRNSPRRITDLSGFHMEGFSATADGKTLLLENSTDQSHVVVGRLEHDGKLADVRRLTMDQRYNVPFAWTPDSKAVLFNSDRTGTFLIYRQAPTESFPELVSTGANNVQMVRTSPDGAFLLYTAVTPNTDIVRMMRVPLAGGAPQRVFEAKVNNFDCPGKSGEPCVAGEDVTDKQILLFAFDPISGSRHELFRLAHSMTNTNWTISPDGSRLAMTGTDPQGRIEIRSLAGQIEKRIQVDGWSNLSSIDWAADGNTLFVSNAGQTDSRSGFIGATLLRVDLQGHAQPLWETTGGGYTWAIASPNGKYLAIREPGVERNVWLLENF
jgi:DNA-binding winged helix-turn-helix (wHTH) protein/Tol biopolymer transport system component